MGSGRSFTFLAGKTNGTLQRKMCSCDFLCVWAEPPHAQQRRKAACPQTTDTAHTLNFTREASTRAESHPGRTPCQFAIGLSRSVRNCRLSRDTIHVWNIYLVRRFWVCNIHLQKNNYMMIIDTYIPCIFFSEPLFLANPWGPCSNLRAWA